jgi:hypothetical protein
VRPRVAQRLLNCNDHDAVDQSAHLPQVGRGQQGNGGALTPSLGA